MNHQEMIPGTEMVLLGAIDPGSAGAIVRNNSAGMLEHIKMPQGESGTDLLAISSYLEGCSMVIMEHPPLGGFSGHTSMSENGCFQQYKEIYGLLTGAKIPFYTIRPKAWQKFLNFPAKKTLGDDVWKDFLHSQAIMRCPSVKKLPLYAADGYLLHRVLTMLYPTKRDQWP